MGRVSAQALHRLRCKTALNPPTHISDFYMWWTLIVPIMLPVEEETRINKNCLHLLFFPHCVPGPTCNTHLLPAPAAIWIRAGKSNSSGVYISIYSCHILLQGFDSLRSAILTNSIPVNSRRKMKSLSNQHLSIICAMLICSVFMKM